MDENPYRAPANLSTAKPTQPETVALRTYGLLGLSALAGAALGQAAAMNWRLPLEGQVSVLSLAIGAALGITTATFAMFEWRRR